MGIDLGTTHTVVAFADTASDSSSSESQLFEIDQLVAPGEVATRALLPSLRYHPAPGEMSPGDMQLPWMQSELGDESAPAVLGELARELGSKVPGRLVASAKSWLSHASVDRTAPILPWGGAAEISKISPLHASASFLTHVRDAWDQHFPKYALKDQDVVLTLPASFDEAARALTIKAAGLANLHRVRLLEEPQAVCYDWLTRHAHEQELLLKDIRLLLICDVGGGTTDFTLIKVGWQAGKPRLERIGVGDHLMLGGDNMDLTLAHLAEQRLLASGVRLGAASLSQLIQQCRVAKESLLAPNAPQTARVMLLGSGAGLIAGARSTELSREEVQDLVLEGFLPRVDADEYPRKRQTAIVEFGLPYVADPAISRHVAAFLGRHTQVSMQALGDHVPIDDKPAMPDAVLLNGGVFHSERLAKRLLDNLAQWRGAPLQELHNTEPDIAVARGAVAYGLSLRGKGLRIGGGSARSYFLQIEDRPQHKCAVCLLPRGSKEEQEVRLKQRSFSLRLGQPVRFHLLSSTADTACQPGEVLEMSDEDFNVLPPIAAVLEDKANRLQKAEVPVQLAAMLSEVGTLGVSCVSIDDSDQRWNLEFQLRGAKGGQIVRPGGSPHPGLVQARVLIERIYGSRSRDVRPTEVKTLRSDLERVLGKRDTWETPLLRELFSSLLEGLRRRRRSADHERLWFNLTGFCLRPGFGYPLDDWRVKQLWQIYKQGVQYVPRAQVWSEWWTLWRRVSGGLDAQAQQRILKDISSDIRASRIKQKRRTGSPKKQGHDDMVRLVGSLERLPVERKIEVGGWLWGRLRSKRESPQLWWAIGRLGARIPFYGSAHNVVPVEVAERWLKQTLAQDWNSVSSAAFAATNLARLSGDRERDLDAVLRDQVAQRLRAAKLSASWIRMMTQVIELDAADERRVFGESLPPGLRLMQ